MKLINKIKAPKFKLKNDKNNIIELKSIKTDFIVLYFYPKDDTPGCTIETKDFNFLLNDFKKLNCTILGVSKDSVESHVKFKNKYNIKFDLMSDEKKIMIKSYKVWGKKKFMGKEFMGIIRSTFLLNKNRKIIKTWKNVKVKGHAEEVLQAIKSIKG